MAVIYQEIDKADFTTANPKVIMEAKEAGLVGEQLASIALGFPEDEYLTARKDHSARIKLIAEQQGTVDKAPLGAAARGAVDLDDNPKSGEDEKAASRDTTLQDTPGDRTRGEGKNNQE
jgi:hypothetical protein